jgi:hypothetical protein
MVSGAYESEAAAFIDEGLHCDDITVPPVAPRGRKVEELGHILEDWSRKAGYAGRA